MSTAMHRGRRVEMFLYWRFSRLEQYMDCIVVKDGGWQVALRQRSYFSISRNVIANGTFFSNIYGLKWSSWTHQIIIVYAEAIFSPNIEALHLKSTIKTLKKKYLGVLNNIVKVYS